MRVIVHVIQCGGTIDKAYFETAENHGRNFEIGQPAFISILKRANFPDERWTYSTACTKDSLDMTDNDRELVYAHVADSKSNYVVITHGTDTMDQTAARLYKQFPEKVIVITGAMQPERLRDSDADFNLGMAIGVIRWLEPGVYLAQEGRVRQWVKF